MRPHPGALRVGAGGNGSETDLMSRVCETTIVALRGLSEGDPLAARAA
jgi:hypothetical protein